ncbi:MAG: tRNA1(Val) (adenine(37)-N6)-methyltransferase [Eubacteriales bacterium SKADARSKE-1]|nr:tRNA1(Val) (adenine(37)-N6)-methyltransferase [Eubacteriales bacterium SKADARSKE-1]
MTQIDEKLEPLGKNISVIVSHEHYFSGDTVLLADFSKPKQYEKAAELGTGCGALVLFWEVLGGTKFTSAIDIQKSACDLAKKSVNLNKLGEKIEVIQADIRESIPGVTLGSYDLVACNPPYKALETGALNLSDAKKTARHETNCTIDDVTNAAYKLLKPGGRAFFCHRAERLCDVLESMRKNKLEPKKIRFVQHRKDSTSKLFLIEGKKHGKPGLSVLPTLLMEDDFGNQSDEIKRIYKFCEENKNGR